MCKSDRLIIIMSITEEFRAHSNSLCARIIIYCASQAATQQCVHQQYINHCFHELSTHTCVCVLCVLAGGIIALYILEIDCLIYVDKYAVAQWWRMVYCGIFKEYKQYIYICVEGSILLWLNVRCVQFSCTYTYLKKISKYMVRICDH